MSGPAAAGMQAVGNGTRQVMSKVAEIARSSDTTVASIRDTSAREREQLHVDRAFNSVEADIANIADHQTRPATESDHRAGLITQILDTRVTILQAVEVGVQQGIRALAKTDRRPVSSLWPLLEYAVSIALAGCAGPIAVAMGKTIAGPIIKKALEDSVKEAIKKAGKAHLPAPPIDDHHELVEAFTRIANNQLLSARTALTSSISVTYDAISTLPTNEIEQLAKHLESDFLTPHPLIVNQVAMSTVVAWTNFLARATYGDMSVWNPWETNGGMGAKELKGAAPMPTSSDERRTVISGNVAPTALYAINSAAQGEQTGILEVDIDLNGTLIEADPLIGASRGMRLENVGPRVRKALKSLATVRGASGFRVALRRGRPTGRGVAWQAHSWAGRSCGTVGPCVTSTSTSSCLASSIRGRSAASSST